MRLIIASLFIAVVCGLAVPAQAQTPNTLSQKEISDGWLLLFDGETDYGWKSQDNFLAKWSALDGSLQTSDRLGMLTTTTEFMDFDFKCEHLDENGGTGGVAVVHRGGFAGFGMSRTSRSGWNTIFIERRGSTLSSGVPGKMNKFPSRFENGRIAIGLMSGGKGNVRFRNIKLRPLGLKSIFNGKDLSGWKVIEGHKSEFSVTKEGWLNIKNGNGEIQTDGTWGDLVLQIEVYSNGDHLNSGVFFREQPGQFWLGYEAQIRNQWEGDDRTRPVDFGTGAIYNRQKVRKVVSSDREWFTMTVTAIGNHLATWVNGIQVTDFTDTRPEDQTNARKGSRTAAGVLGLQGHDPTTDLSFRNIRIAEIPAK